MARVQSEWDWSNEYKLKYRNLDEARVSIEGH